MLSRAELRAELTRKRLVYSPTLRCSYPVCSICRDPIIGGGEIHESLITRGMIRDPSKDHLILVPENSNLVHATCHPKSGRGNPYEFSQCVDNLFSWEKDGVVEWLENIEGEFKLTTTQARRDYLNALNNGHWSLSMDSGKVSAPETYAFLEEMNSEK
jgi:hypothetical protein